MPEVSQVRFTPARPEDVASGLLGWATFRVGGFHFDGVAVRRARRGRLILAYPWRRDRRGRRHPYIRPIDDATRRELERQILDAIGALD